MFALSAAPSARRQFHIILLLRLVIYGMGLSGCSEVDVNPKCESLLSGQDDGYGAETGGEYPGVSEPEVSPVT